MSDGAFWGAPQWATAAITILILATLAVAWNYWRAPGPPAIRLTAALLKFAGLASLVVCLAEPLISRRRPRPGANLFAVVVDDSQSLQIRDPQSGASRSTALQRALEGHSAWQTRLGQTFDVRRFAFNDRLRGVQDFSELSFQGDRTALAATLQTLARRFQGLPLGGVLLLTDGNATDELVEGAAWAGLPPIYPVVPGSSEVPPDVRVERVAVRQTNFEDAPVTLTAEVRRTGDAAGAYRVDELDGNLVEVLDGYLVEVLDGYLVEVLDEAGNVLQIAAGPVCPRLGGRYAAISIATRAARRQLPCRAHPTQRRQCRRNRRQRGHRGE